MRGLGQGVKEFKKGMNEVNASFTDEENDNNSEELKPSENPPTEILKNKEKNGSQQR